MDDEGLMVMTVYLAIVGLSMSGITTCYFIYCCKVKEERKFFVKDIGIYGFFFIVGTALLIFNAWNYNHYKNLPYSVNNYTYSITKFSDESGYYKSDGSHTTVLAKNDEGNYKTQSVPTDAIEYNFSDSEEPSITIRKKEYQWTWYDRVENWGKDQALEDYDEIEKVVLTIPKE